MVKNFLKKSRSAFDVRSDGKTNIVVVVLWIVAYSSLHTLHR